MRGMPLLTILSERDALFMQKMADGKIKNKNAFLQENEGISRLSD